MDSSIPPRYIPSCMYASLGQFFALRYPQYNRLLSSLWFLLRILIPKTPKDNLHPTQKPVELLEYLINTYTNDGDLVLDNCMGSGSTGIACLKTNRNFIGIEKEVKYFNIAKERIENFESLMITDW